MANSNIEERIIEFQKMEKQLELYVNQKYQFEIQLAETGNALDEMNKTDDKVELYKASSGFFLRTNKEKAIEELTSRKTLLDSRIKMFKEQEEKLRNNLTRLGKTLEEEMKNSQSK